MFLAPLPAGSCQISGRTAPLPCMRQLHQFVRLKRRLLGCFQVLSDFPCQCAGRADSGMSRCRTFLSCQRLLVFALCITQAPIRLWASCSCIWPRRAAQRVPVPGVPSPSVIRVAHRHSACEACDSACCIAWCCVHAMRLLRLQQFCNVAEHGRSGLCHSLSANWRRARCCSVPWMCR